MHYYYYMYCCVQFKRELNRVFSKRKKKNMFFFHSIFSVLFHMYCMYVCCSEPTLSMFGWWIPKTVSLTLSRYLKSEHIVATYIMKKREVFSKFYYQSLLGYRLAYLYRHKYISNICL